MLHLKDYRDPAWAWRQLFSGLGTAIREALTANPYRKGVPPGVKATLV